MDHSFANISISPAELDTVAELITMRFPLRAPEARRLARMRGLMTVTSDLNRTLSTYAQHALVHCHGTAGTSDLSADTAALTQALRSFCAEIRMIAAEYESINRPALPYLDAERPDEGLMPDFMPWLTPTHVACPPVENEPRRHSA
jgi:hypothetical protein